MARRAHARVEDHEPRRARALLRRRVPVRLRQDQPRDADPHRARVEGRDHRRRHRVDEVRCRRAPARDQPGVRVLRRGAGHQRAVEPNAIHTLDRNTVFTNTALTDDGDVWWEDLTDEPPAHLTDWHGESWTPESGGPAAHPNSRFCVPAAQCPSIAPEWQDPAGVPISAFLFGGRRARPPFPSCSSRTTGATACSSPPPWAPEQTAAATGEVGELRPDPFAMLPFCGYNMGDYLAHWLSMTDRTEEASLPTIYGVNWFRKGARRQVPVARLRRELPRARVDLPPARRRRRGCGHRHRRRPPAVRPRPRRARRARRRRRRRAHRRRRWRWRRRESRRPASYFDELRRRASPTASTVGEQLDAL